MEHVDVPTYTWNSEKRPRSFFVMGVVCSAFIHVAFGSMFYFFDESVVRSAARVQRLCEGGRRCPMHASYRRRWGIDDVPLAAAGLIQARVVPRLGMAEKDRRALPELTKYEQPEQVEDGVNISQDNPDKFKFSHRAFEKKKAQLDRKYRKKRKSLNDLLSGPDNPDPRRRARHLSRIIGDPHGSPWGTGTEASDGNAYLSDVQMELFKNFRIPTHIEDRKVKLLRTWIDIKKMNDSGEVLHYKITRRSGNKDYDLAAEATIKRFMPSEGGTKRLPVPDGAMLRLINSRGGGMRIDFDGALFHR